LNITQPSHPVDWASQLPRWIGSLSCHQSCTPATTFGISAAIWASQRPHWGAATTMGGRGMAPHFAQYGVVTAIHGLHVQVWYARNAWHSPCVSQGDWGGKSRCGVHACAVMCVGLVMLVAGCVATFGAMRCCNCHAWIACASMVCTECWAQSMCVTWVIGVVVVCVHAP
jgi:hypothetical protein